MWPTTKDDAVSGSWSASSDTRGQAVCRVTVYCIWTQFRCVFGWVVCGKNDECSACHGWQGFFAPPPRWEIAWSNCSGAICGFCKVAQGWSRWFWGNSNDHAKLLTFYVPATKPPGKIESVQEWSRAFLVFQSAHLMYFPEKSGQLLEYKVYIEHIAHSFEWHKVYAYDKHFRRVQAKNLFRLWNLVNQVAKDKYLLKSLEGKVSEGKPSTSSPDKPKSHKKGEKKNKGKRDLCRRWNTKNACHFNERCKFEHQCAICRKPSHGAVACHKHRDSGPKGPKSETWSTTSTRVKFSHLCNPTALISIWRGTM